MRLFVRVGLLAVMICGCAAPQVRPPPPAPRQEVVELLRQLENIPFTPLPSDQLYPFSFSFAKVDNGQVLRRGRGFVLVRGDLWCLVEKWGETGAGAPGRRFLVVDRRRRQLEAEVRRWPATDPHRWGNNWQCLRLAEMPAYSCTYTYPEGSDHRLLPASAWPLYQDLRWNREGLLCQVTRYGRSTAVFFYRGLRLTRIEFRKAGRLLTATTFDYR